MRPLSFGRGLGYRLVHTEDTCLLERKKRYGDEAGRNFSGTVHVPDDLETIPLHGHLGK